MNNIKIDQIRLNIPYEYVSKIDLINSKHSKLNSELVIRRDN